MMISRKMPLQEQSNLRSNGNPSYLRRRPAKAFLLTSLLWLAGLLAAPGASFAQAPLTDDADSQNKFNAGILALSPQSNVYLKFKLTSTLPANTPGSKVAKATIKLYISAVTSAGTIEVFQLVSDWTERTISPFQPILGNVLQSGIPVQADQEGKFLVIDVTTVVQEWLGTDGLGTGGAPNDGVALVSRNGASLTFDSKENRHEAQLNLQMVDDTGPGGTVTNVSTNAPLSVTNSRTTPNISLGIVPVVNGGTGLSAPGPSTNFLRSNGSAWTSTPLTATDIPAGSLSYIQNSTSPQTADFNIAGTGKALVLDAASQFNLGGNRVLSQPGTNNLFAGPGAGAVNAGQGNSFFGASAGLANTTGDFSAFFGSGAGQANTGGSNNSFFGSNAGLSNTTGFQNSFFGREAGANNTTGSFNSFFGRSTGLHNTTGQANDFFGQDAGGKNTTGENNTFFGNASGLENLTGSSNAFFGNFAGNVNATGSNNTIIGEGANVGASDLNFATALGSGAVVNASNTVVLGRTADTVQVPGALVTRADIVVGSSGQGIILKSPNGAMCRRISIDDAGNLTLAAVTCP